MTHSARAAGSALLLSLTLSQLSPAAPPAASAPAMTKPASTSPAVDSLRLISREVVFTTPREGVRVESQAFYTRPPDHEKRLEMMRYRVEQSKSDKMDAGERSFSPDNGKTWGEPERVTLLRKTAEGFERTGLRAWWLDPVNGLLVNLSGRSITRADEPREVPARGNVTYAVSTDGGRTAEFTEPIVQGPDREGEPSPYTIDHPFEGVWTGKNTVGYGDRTCMPIRTRAGEILQPVQASILGEDDKPYNPTGGFTYTEAGVLIGKWQPDHHIRWKLSARVRIDPKLSSRGLIEPTLAELPDGRILMVMRGSSTTTPGRRWRSLSSDGGHTWGPAEPWTYSDGSSFFSPSSCSQLLTHSNGQIYWLGNIVPKPPKGNSPRYPFVIGRVDPASGLLVRQSVAAIDDRGPDDSPELMLSNFRAIEDRETGDILLHMSRAFATKGFTTDAYVYRIGVGK
ncbi:MAG: sialidase family protein [Planctomycetota bacterium]|nr:sialidase family protein [Planctomycetota bacterium]